MTGMVNEPTMVMRGEHVELPLSDVPPNAVRLAESALCRNRAFRVGKRAYAFQFHVEVDCALAAARVARLPADTHLDERCRADVERIGHGIIGRFFEVALAGLPMK